VNLFSRTFLITLIESGGLGLFTLTSTYFLSYESEFMFVLALALSIELLEFSIRYLLLPLFSNLENLDSLNPVNGIGFVILM